MNKLFSDKSVKRCIEDFLFLGIPVLEGCRDIYERIRTVLIICRDLGVNVASDPSHIHYAKFEYFRGLMRTFCSDLHGGANLPDFEATGIRDTSERHKDNCATRPTEIEAILRNRE